MSSYSSQTRHRNKVRHALLTIGEQGAIVTMYKRDGTVTALHVVPSPAALVGNKRGKDMAASRAANHGDAELILNAADRGGWRTVKLDNVLTISKGGICERYKPDPSFY